MQCEPQQAKSGLPPQPAKTACVGNPALTGDSEAASARASFQSRRHSSPERRLAVDLGNIPEKLVRKVPLTTWFRFARVVEKMPAALVFLMTCPVAQSCAGLTLRLERAVPVFHPSAQKPRAPGAPERTGASTVSHAQFLSQLKCEVEIGRARARKPVQSAVRPRFAVAPVWASRGSW